MTREEFLLKLTEFTLAHSVEVIVKEEDTVYRGEIWHIVVLQLKEHGPTHRRYAVEEFSNYRALATWLGRLEIQYPECYRLNIYLLQQ